MLQSVADQGYPDLEFLVLDGGSQDGTCQLLREAGGLITRWVSGPDLGQSDALNQGLSWATGDLIGWLNSDDVLLPGALRALGETYRALPSPLILADVEMRDLRTSRCWRIHQHNVTLQTFRQPWRYPVTWAQPGTYFSRPLLIRTGPLCTDMHHLFDWEWMCRALKWAEPRYLSHAVAAFHYHEESKTSILSAGWVEDRSRILELHAPDSVRSQPDLLRACLQLSLAQDCWACHWRERRQGWRYLLQSVQSDWRVLGWPRTWLAALKSLMPFELQHSLRAFLQGY